MTMMGRDDYAKTYSLIKSRKSKNKGLIYIEDITDKPFWERIATEHTVSLYSEQGGKIITGKSKLLEVCSANQLIAIDSDFDEICPDHRAESILFANKKNFILQTYSHSLENLLYSPKCLEQVLDSKFKLYVDNHRNDILKILTELSEIWFEPYRKFLFLLNKRLVEHKKDWIEIIKFHETECQDIALKSDFSAYKIRIQELSDDLNKKIINQTDAYQRFCALLNNKNYNLETVFYFIRGHDFEEKFVLPIMDMICSDRIKKEFGEMDTQYPDKDLEKKEQNSKVGNHFKKKFGIQTVMYNYFYDIYFEHAIQNDFFIKKIIWKYKSIWQPELF